MGKVGCGKRIQSRARGIKKKFEIYLKRQDCSKVQKRVIHNNPRVKEEYKIKASEDMEKGQTRKSRVNKKQ